MQSLRANRKRADVMCITHVLESGSMIERPRPKVKALSERRRVAPSDVDGEGDPLRLLVIEDDPSYRAYIAALTRRLGFDTDIAADGAAAIEQLSKSAYDVAIIDQQMPRMTGVELIRRIRDDPVMKTLCTVMLTAREDIDTKLAALEAGFDDFLTKGSSEAEIAAKLIAAKRIAARQRSLDTTIRELHGLATHDELTGLFNRRFFTSEAERLLADGAAIGLILFDLDGFKRVNDTFGHLAGDHVLRDIGGLFLRNTRAEDLVARYGGDEFVMLLTGQHIDEIELVAQRLTDEIAALRWIAGADSFSISVTSGIATSISLAQPAVAQLFAIADRNLYKNKQPRVTLSEPAHRENISRGSP